MLAGVAALYLVVNSGFSEVWEIIPLKEIIVGFLFSAGTLLVMIVQLALVLPNVGRWPALLAMLFFAILCSLNCMSIAVWECALDRAQRKHSIATRWPGAGQPIRVCCFVVAATALSLPLFARSLFPIAISISAGAALLSSLHSLSVENDDRTALADLVLLTPFAFFVVEFVL